MYPAVPRSKYYRSDKANSSNLALDIVPGRQRQQRSTAQYPKLANIQRCSLWTQNESNIIGAASRKDTAAETKRVSISQLGGGVPSISTSQRQQVYHCFISSFGPVVPYLSDKRRPNFTIIFLTVSPFFHSTPFISDQTITPFNSFSPATPQRLGTAIFFSWEEGPGGAFLLRTQVAQVPLQRLPATSQQSSNKSRQAASFPTAIAAQ